MDLSRALFATLFLAGQSVSAIAVPAPSTLTYINQSAQGQQLTLRRDGERLMIIDDHSHAILASALAKTTQHVVVRGADDVDDTLTLDVTNGFFAIGRHRL